MLNIYKCFCCYMYYWCIIRTEVLWRKYQNQQTSVINLSFKPSDQSLTNAWFKLLLFTRYIATTSEHQIIYTCSQVLFRYYVVKLLSLDNDGQFSCTCTYILLKMSKTGTFFRESELRTVNSCIQLAATCSLLEISITYWKNNTTTIAISTTHQTTSCLYYPGHHI